MTSQNPNTFRETFATGLATAVLTGGGGFISAIAGLPAGATAALCGLPLVVATVVATRRLGILSMVIYGLCCTVALLKDLKEPASLASSAFVLSSILATLALAVARRRRHERTVVGLERLNHQILGDPGRKHEVSSEAARSRTSDSVHKHDALLTKLHEAGRRIATHSDLDALIPIIITEARNLFHCGHVEVRFWNHQARHLSRPFPERARDIGRYEPNPATGATAWVVATQQLFLAEVVDRNADLAAATAGDPRRPAALVPLIAGNDMIGILVLDELERGAELSPMTVWTFANLCALGLRNSQLVEQVTDAARRDPLTGLLDETGFALAAEKRLVQTSVDSVNAIIAADLDAFGLLASRHGHRTSNAVLADAARLWKAALPEEAVLGRFEGDGFLAFLPKCGSSQAEQIAEELRETVASHPFGCEGESFRLTCRLGVVAFKRHDLTVDNALQVTAGELRRAKAEGGNTVCSAAPEAVTR